MFAPTEKHENTNGNHSEAFPHVVIIGAGFGGLAAAMALKRAPVRITFVDRFNHHLFQPLLYQVASAVLSASDIAAPIRWIVRHQTNTNVLLAEATRIDVHNKRVHFTKRSMEYDTLVVAAGVSHDYFGNDEWAEHAPGIKSLDDALEVRRRILFAYEQAEWCANPVERRKLLTFVVVGGGATGVELAGALSEIALHSLSQDFRQINPIEARVVLIEGGNKLLSGFRDPIPASALKQLEAIGVEVIIGEQVTKVDSNGVVLGQERLEAATVLWAAGVRGAPFSKTLKAPKDQAGRIIVEPDCSIPGYPEVFVIGDLANYQHGNKEGALPLNQPLPGVAQTAIQMGNHVAKCLAADRAFKPRSRFVYKDLGSMATIGRNKAVVDIAGLQLGGIIAWLIWLFVHLMSIVGFRNRLMVLIQWCWSYLSFQRNSRLIRGGKARDSVL